MFLKYKNKFDYIICMSVFNNFGSKKIANRYIKNFNYILNKKGNLLLILIYKINIIINKLKLKIKIFIKKIQKIIIISKCIFLKM